jgi:hypothetical protein
MYWKLVKIICDKNSVQIKAEIKFKNYTEHNTTENVLGDHLPYKLIVHLWYSKFIFKYTEPPNTLTMASIEQRIPPWHTATIKISKGLHANELVLINTVQMAFLPFDYAPETTV